MRALYSFLVIIIVMSFLGSCRKDFSTVTSQGALTFSKDTVFLDTVFTRTSSSTRSFKVYNKSNKAITIPTIELARGENSYYRLNVDGSAGKSFKNIDILAKDSIYIFVEATIDFDNVTNPIYTDSIVFDKSNNFQDVDLVTLVQDATFYFPERSADKIKETIVLGVDDEGNNIGVNGRLLKDNELVWTNEKPHVVYDFIGVPEGKTLTIQAGAKVHFHNNSGLLVQKGATLKVAGSFENEVVFEGDRLEPNFSDVAGQWSAIWLRSGSVNNSINYAIIKNASVGLLVDGVADGTNPKVQVKNTQFYNFSNYGLLARHANLNAENLVMGNAGQSLLALTAGGTYTVIHSTFANYWRGGFRKLPAVLVNNYLATINDGKEVITPFNLLQANFTNCIIDGSDNLEFTLDKVDDADFNFNVSHCMLKFNTTNAEILDNPLYKFDNASLYQNIIQNGTPNFKSTSKNQLFIGKKSDAINKASKIGANLVPIDINRFNRIVTPDIGAYQHIDFKVKVTSAF